jgi:microsomal epoxide hydrolase
MRMLSAVLAASFAVACAPDSWETWAQLDARSGHFRTSDGIKLHYLEAGSGPTLVLVPGWTMPAEIWEHQIRHFASTHRVVAFDPRGQGRSEKPSHGYYPSRRALDIGELLEHLGGEPGVIVGWSLAVQEILVYAHEIGTDAIRAAVLVDHPIAEFDATGFSPRFVDLQLDRATWTRSFIEDIFATPQSDEYLRTLTQAALSTPTNAAAIMIANLILMGPTELRPALDSLDRPLLFVASSQDWAVAVAEQVREGWPGAHVEVIDGTSHALFVDKPEEFNRVLGEFLATLPE